ILLVGCYVVNLGYIALTVAQWGHVDDAVEMMGVLSERIAVILFALAWLHYQNIGVLMIWARFKHRQTPTGIPNN
ncbi:MAG TPA: hypothetical protein PK760_11055, partial [Flavobacteriales bacterium]|nr:hypothetical protein [Flavobacteriales bacterium]